MTTGKQRDKWDKWETVLKIAVSALTPILVAVFGIAGTYYLRSQQEIATRASLYAQLMSGREKSDSDLRQAMFDVIIKTFLMADADGNRKVNEEILALELLAYNFHDAIDIGPLFDHVKKNIDRQFGANRNASSNSCPRKIEPRTEQDELHDDLVDRLHKVAREVTRKQLATLDDGGATFNIDIDLEALNRRISGKASSDDIVVDPEDLVLVSGDFVVVDSNEAEGDPRIVEAAIASGNHEKGSTLSNPLSFHVDVLASNDAKKELHVRLEIADEGNAGDGARDVEIDADFWLGFFDFPMIDNTRLADGNRFALVLRNYQACSFARIAIAYFPNSRASLKEKAYFDEIFDQLKVTQDIE